MIGIRVDANREIATGHLMRCLSIAQEMKRNRIDCVFITTDKFALQIILANGFESIYLESTWNNLENELEQLSKIIREHRINELIVDSYFVTKRYFEQLILITKIIYIDDLNSFQYHVSMLINYNIYAEMLDYPGIYCNTDTKLLLGCHYAPLRSEFISVIPSFRENVKKVFITAGGTDQFNFAGKLLESIIRKSLFFNLEFHVVLGKLNSHLNYLQDLAGKSHLVFLHQDVKDMSALMTECDIAVSAGGSTLYELCACGVPTICISSADNQLLGVKGFEDEGLMSYAGDIRMCEEECISNIISLIDLYEKNPGMREERSNSMRSEVDGYGTSRIVAAIMDL